MEVAYEELEDFAISLYPGPSTKQEARAFIRAVIMLAVAVGSGRLEAPPLLTLEDVYSDVRRR